MDPITTAIVTALGAGAGKALGDRGVKDAYDKVKSLLGRLFGKGSDVAQAVEAVEADPAAEGSHLVLAGQVMNSGAHQNDELVRAAKELLAAIEASGGTTTNTQTIRGTNVAATQGGGDATVNVNEPKGDG